jgi:hypothetical protein
MKIKIVTISMMAALVLVAPSCKKYLDVNDTPNNPLSCPTGNATA